MIKKLNEAKGGLEGVGTASKAAEAKLNEMAGQQLEGSPEKVEANSISIMGDSLTISGELVINAQSVSLSGDIKQGKEASGSDPTVVRSQTPEEQQQGAVVQRKEELMGQVEGRKDVGVVDRGSLEGKSPAEMKAIQTNAKSAEQRTRATGTVAKTSLDANAVKLKEAKGLRSTAKTQLTKQAKKPAGTENLEAIKKYEQQLKDADSAIEDITAKQIPK